MVKKKELSFTLVDKKKASLHFLKKEGEFSLDLVVKVVVKGRMFSYVGDQEEGKILP